MDLAPEGCISLRRLYEKYLSWKWSGGDPYAVLNLPHRLAALPIDRQAQHRAALDRVTNESLHEIVRLFQALELGAFVVPPPGSERRYLTSEAWEEAHFPERMFLSDTIVAGHGAEFDAAVGRTPFVVEDHANTRFETKKRQRAASPSSSALRECLIELAMDGSMSSGDVEKHGRAWNLPPFTSRPDPKDYDPTNRVVWTMPMTVAWMAWRTYASVRDAMDDYRTNCWEWFGYQRRLPVNGGETWYEVDGEELRPLEPLSMFGLGLMEALDVDFRDDRLQMSVKSAREELWRKLTEGKLVATAVDAKGAVVQVPAHEWPYIVLEADSRQRDRLVFSENPAQEAYRKPTLRQADIVLLWPGKQDEEMQFFDLDEASWSLLQAAIWVGCGGRRLSSRQIADDDLEERGAYELFRSLFPHRGLVATGLNQKRVREVIPAEYFELATMDPGMAHRMHYVSFIDDVLEETGGQLTPFGESNPRWFGIRIARDALFAAFPDFSSGAGIAAAQATTDEPKGRKVESAREAMRALYPEGTPKGLTEKDRLTAVNKWLKENGHSTVSQRTLVRAASS